MSSVILLFILLVICGVSAASFASDRNRSQPGWFWIGMLTGPVGLLAVLMLPDLENPWKPGRVKRLILSATGMLAILLILGAGLLEVNARYEMERRSLYLERWEIYGDALLRFSRVNRQSSDALVVKLARDQIREYQDELTKALRQVDADLRLAIDGYAEVSGVRAFFLNLFRMMTLRAPESPAVTTLSLEEQEERIADLQKLHERYSNHLDKIQRSESGG